MVINSQLKQELKKNGIPVSEGILYLLGLHYNLDTNLIPDKVKKKILALKIVERKYNISSSHGIDWNIPLFENQIVEFEWVEAWREQFRYINPERAGVLATCKERMIKLFSEYDYLTPELVQQATEMYLMNVGNPEYIKTSHRFIYDGHWSDKNSMLIQYVEQVRNNQSVEII